MRWTQPEIGDTRVIEQFLIFPVYLNDEWRWWEWAEIKQVYTLDSDLEIPHAYWKNEEWTD